MRILTPFEFVERFPERQRVAFVGNAPSLLGEGLGSWIDDHDIVVRFNDCPIEGFEQDVGLRTTILIANPYPEGKRPPRLTDANAAIFILAPQTRRGDASAFNKWASDASVLFSYSPDLVGVGNIEHKSGLTTGSYGLHLLTRLLSPQRVSITGFTMFLANTRRHYWKTAAPSGLGAHDVEVEAAIFIRLCNNIRCSVEVTEEVAWVARQTAIPLRRDVMIRRLKNGRWQT